MGLVTWSPLSKQQQYYGRFLEMRMKWTARMIRVLSRLQEKSWTDSYTDILISMSKPCSSIFVHYYYLQTYKRSKLKQVFKSSSPLIFVNFEIDDMD